MTTDIKLRCYLDSTIPNYLFADDTPEKKAVTIRLWEEFVADKYEIILSDLVFDELSGSKEPKLSLMFEQMRRIKFENLSSTDEIKSLALQYKAQGVMGPSDNNDADRTHIAFAVIGKAQVILSWNFHDIVKKDTRDKVQLINSVSRYNEIWITSPDEFLKGGSRWNMTQP